MSEELQKWVTEARFNTSEENGLLMLALANEAARLRSVCRMAADVARNRRSFMVQGQSGYTQLTALIADLEQAGKETE